VWRAQVPALAVQGPLILPDLSPSRVGPSIAEAEAVLQAAEASGARRFILIGHSRGGAVAVEAARALGPRCRMLVGVDSFTDAAFYAARPDAEIAQRLAPFAADFAGAMAAMVARITLAGGTALAAEIAQRMGAEEPEASLAQMRALLSWDIEARWLDLRCPATAILSGPLHLPKSALVLPGLDP
jgi:pimeloyl-ACP methyl ester carboxylesterase